jgi:triacylglycerol lipase
MNIVLVHGILGFSHIDAPVTPLDYFAGIAAHLRTNFHASVFAPALDPTGGTELRSGMLGKSIEKALRRWSAVPRPPDALDPAEPIHIIAHSMGGLDARRLICTSPSIDGVRIESLATIGTPHFGSPIADIASFDFLPDVLGHNPLFGSGEAALQKILGHFRISLDGLHDLRTGSATQFNKNFPNRTDVRYLSFAGRGRNGSKSTCAFFLPFYEIIRLHVHEDNDGLVAVSSARWGEFDGDLWPADHADEIGHDLDRPLGPPGKETLARYSGIVRHF